MSTSLSPDPSLRTTVPGASPLLRRVLPAVVVVALLVVAWQVYVTVSGIRPQVLPSPLRVVQQAGGRGTPSPVTPPRHSR